jgi:hypothetical protein
MINPLQPNKEGVDTTVKLTTLSETISDYSAKFHAFALVPTSETDFQERYILPKKTGSSVTTGSYLKHPDIYWVTIVSMVGAACVHTSKLSIELGVEGSGWGSTTVMKLPQGAVIKLFGSGIDGWGKPRRMGVMYLRIRETGPLQSVSMLTLGQTKNSKHLEKYKYQSGGECLGRFDILKESDFVRMGMKTEALDSRGLAFDPQDTSVFNITVHKGETRRKVVTTPKVVYDKEGKAVLTYHSRASRRSIKM